MKTLAFFALTLILVGFAQLEDPRRHIDSIELRAKKWIDDNAGIKYKKIVKHSEHDTNKGGKVCYRAIHVVYVDVFCLEWDSARDKIKPLEQYRLSVQAK